MDGREKIVLLAREHVVAHGHAGRNEFDDATFYKFLGELRVFELLAYGHTLAGPYELGQIAVECVMRKSRQFNELGRAVGATGEGDAEYFRCLYGIFGESLVKVAYTEEEHRVGMLCLHLGVLLHQRRLYIFFSHFSLFFAGDFTFAQRYGNRGDDLNHSACEGQCQPVAQLIGIVKEEKCPGTEKDCAPRFNAVQALQPQIGAAIRGEDTGYQQKHRTGCEHIRKCGACQFDFAEEKRYGCGAKYEQQGYGY